MARGGLLGLVLVAIFVKLQPLQGPDGHYLGHDYYHYLTRTLYRRAALLAKRFRGPALYGFALWRNAFFRGSPIGLLLPAAVVGFRDQSGQATHLTILLFYVGRAMLGFFKLAQSGVRIPSRGGHHIGPFFSCLNGFSFSHLLVGILLITAICFFLGYFIFFLMRRARDWENFSRDVSLFLSLSFMYFIAGGCIFWSSLPSASSFWRFRYFSRGREGKIGTAFLLFLVTSFLGF